MSGTEEFYRIKKLPPYVFAVINEMKAKARAAQMDVVDLGMGNPDGATPEIVVEKLIEAARNPKNHRYSVSRGIPHLRQEIVKRYKRKHNVDLDPDTEAIVTMGAKDALAHLLNPHARPAGNAVGHWRGEVAGFLSDARDRYTPSMRQRIDMAELYADALYEIGASADESGPALPLPRTCPFSLDELLAPRTDVGVLVSRLR